MCVKVAVHDMSDTNLFKLETSFSKKGFCKYVALGKMNGQPSLNIVCQTV